MNFSSFVQIAYVSLHMLSKFLFYDLIVSSLFIYYADDKVTVLESEKRAWENSPEAQTLREALNPWRNHDSNVGKKS